MSRYTRISYCRPSWNLCIQHRCICRADVECCISSHCRCNCCCNRSPQQLLKSPGVSVNQSVSFLTRNSSYWCSEPSQFCLSVCLSVTRVDQSKTVQARITKFSPSAAWKTLVSRTVKLFDKFEGGHPERISRMRGGKKNLRFPADTALAERDKSHPLVITSKTLYRVGQKTWHFSFVHIFANIRSTFKVFNGTHMAECAIERILKIGQ